MPALNLLTVGVLAGILGPGRRFSTDAQLAAYAGTAPLEASSAGLIRRRLNRGGNRRLNCILHRIVLTQAHHSQQTLRHARNLAVLDRVSITRHSGSRCRRLPHRSVPQRVRFGLPGLAVTLPPNARLASRASRPE